jgi:hypothetical protein
MRVRCDVVDELLDVLHGCRGAGEELLDVFVHLGVHFLLAVHDGRDEAQLVGLLCADLPPRKHVLLCPERSCCVRSVHRTQVQSEQLC